LWHDGLELLSQNGIHHYNQDDLISFYSWAPTFLPEPAPSPGGTSYTSPQSPEPSDQPERATILPLPTGLEPLGKRQKEFAEGEGPLAAERAGASESLGRGEGSAPTIQNPSAAQLQELRQRLVHLLAARASKSSPANCDSVGRDSVELLAGGASVPA